jgi:uncharacterized protein (TIGR02145 family)
MVNIVEEQKKRIRYMYSFMFKRYKANTLADGGAVEDDSIIRDYLKMSQNNRMDKSIRFGWLGEAGSKIESGKVSKAYSFDFNNYQNNATQTTAGSRPYLTGNIAPNEKLGLKNPNGGSNFMTHPTISFAANESWSVTTVLNWNSDYSKIADLFGSYISTPRSGFRLTEVYNKFDFNSSNGTEYAKGFANWSIYKGKNVIQQLVADGSGNLKLYLNNTEIAIWTGISTVFSFSDLYRGNLSYIFTGQIKSHIIRSQALTPTQVTAEYTYLRSVYPEIESVVIGTQTWATSNCEMAATPMGNVIAEMQAAGNVEKITNAADREFSSDTGWWSRNSNWTISGGTANSDGTNTGFGNMYKSFLTRGKYYKLTFTITSRIAGSMVVAFGSADTGSTTGNISTAGTYTFYLLQKGDSNLYVSANPGFIGSIDNISVQEIGWSGSQELYDGIYAQTSGTVEQKTYAAVKAAAMWCHYNNDVALGAVYGKLYNWFAVKLLQMDIDYYNTANPTALWGWRAPTQADLQTLSTYLGGDAISGGKLKKEGTTYWNSPNTGADNSSGFSAIGSDIRSNDGSFSTSNQACQILTITENSTTTITTLDLKFDFSTFNYGNRSKIRGSSVRLIKTT